jgi:hypothetical protein
MRLASQLAERHNLTLYDAVYAAVAQARSAELVTLDRALLAAKLGSRPSELVEAIADARSHKASPSASARSSGAGA